MMRSALVLAAMTSVAICSPVAGAEPASPFPAGYEAAYSAYLAALPPEGRRLAWLTRLEGVAAQPQPLKMAGRPVIYLFACKEKNCDTNNTNIFLLPDRKQVRAVIKVNGVQALIGGAGALEIACVKTLDASGGVAKAC